MLRFNFQIICILVLYEIIQVNYGETQKNKANIIVYFEQAKCENNNCCDDFGKLLGTVVCKKVTSIYYSYEFPDIKHLPGKVFQGKNIESIVINDSDVTVDSNLLEGISALSEFVVQRSSIKAIPDFKFVKDSIRKIYIESSHLTSLEGENLQILTRLRLLSFKNNSIQSIDPNFLKGTVNVTYLDLSYNQLTFIPETLLEPMKKLEFFVAKYNNLLHVNNVFTVTRPDYISLRNNKITDISSALQFNFEKNEMWKIVKCQNDEFYKRTFRSMFSIVTLDLSYNSIKETSQSIFTCLIHFFHEISYVLEISYFTLDENNLKHLNFLLRYLIIESLLVSKNQIEYLTDEDFKFTTGIVYLKLSKNKIKRIDAETFKPLITHLKYLDMSWNSITSLNGSMRFLSNLRHLTLGRNSIKSFAADEFLELDELTVLNLEHNQIKAIGLLQQLHRLQHLAINDNDIELVRPDLVSETLQEMNLTNNPIKCNCLFDLLIRRLSARSVRTDIHTICSKHVPAVGVQKKFNSQDLCTYRCTQYKNYSYIFVDCSSKNLALVPQFPENYFVDVETLGSDILATDIKGKSYIFHIKDQILGISLENNSLESLDSAQLPPNIIQLYLSENKLRRLPESILENHRNLKQVTLSGNPWKCDCGAIKFKKWLTFEKEKIKDIDSVRCGIIGDEDARLNGSVIIDLIDLELCPTNIALNVLTPSGALMIEKRNPNIHLCFHIRDFIPGELIVTNITRAIQNSKKTVLILSKFFLKSEWCLLEARTAHSQAMEDKLHRIVVIKVGDLPKDMDPLIKTYLASTTYITWGESNFWNKLLYVLPSHISGIETNSDNMEENETGL